ncbi:MAG: co-chaperone DjlA, partial [Gammaproteobacteria bacterium]|nr:co-chaperone DjlA [Gammaproteobacteria bacterium]
MGLIVIGAIIGLLAGGIPGLFIGGLIGYGAGAVLQWSVVGGLRIVQSQLVDSTFAVMGALCKADKVVTRDEINAVEQMLSMLKLHGEPREQAKAAF